MKRKLILWNITVLVLIFISYLLLLKYSYRSGLDYEEIFYLTNWVPFFYFLLYIPLAILLAAFCLKTKDFIQRASIISIILSSLIFIYILSSTALSYLQMTNLLEERRAEYIEEAKLDIKNDQIKFISYGLQLPIYTETGYKKIDSLYRKNGIVKTFSCIIDDLDIEARKVYEDLTNQYLEKRNGKNWQQKMQLELEKIENNPIYKLILTEQIKRANLN